MERFGRLSRVEFVLGAGALLTGCGGGTITPGTIAATSSQLLNGVWTLQASSGRPASLSLRFRADNQRYGSVFILSEDASTEPGPTVSMKAPDGFRIQAVTPRIDAANMTHVSRDAGEFNLVGFDGNRTTGDVVFAARPNFAASVTAMSLSTRELLMLTLSGASVQDVELIKGVFADADVSTVAVLNQSTQDVQSALTLKQLLPSMTARDLMVFLAHNITPTYVLDLQDAGLQNLAPADVINLRQARIDGAFVGRQTLCGVVPSPSELLPGCCVS